MLNNEGLFYSIQGQVNYVVAPKIEKGLVIQKYSSGKAH